MKTTVWHDVQLGLPCTLENYPRHWHLNMYGALVPTCACNHSPSGKWFININQAPWRLGPFDTKDQVELAISNLEKG